MCYSAATLWIEQKLNQNLVQDNKDSLKKVLDEQNGSFDFPSSVIEDLKVNIKYLRFLRLEH